MEVKRIRGFHVRKEKLSKLYCLLVKKIVLYLKRRHPEINPNRVGTYSSGQYSDGGSGVGSHPGGCRFYTY